MHFATQNRALVRAMSLALSSINVVTSYSYWASEMCIQYNYKQVPLDFLKLLAGAVGFGRNGARVKTNV